MITLEQFKATKVFVDDISAYDGSNYSRPGFVYMDGTLSIERWKDGWLLIIGSEETVGVYFQLGELEEKLYNWAKDEYGSMFDTEYRIPPCPSNPTEQQMREWFRGMHVRGLSFHPDDRPEEVVSGTQNKFLFHDNECEALRLIMRDLFRLHGYRMHEVANEVVGVTTGGEE